MATHCCDRASFKEPCSHTTLWYCGSLSLWKPLNGKRKYFFTSFSILKTQKFQTKPKVMAGKFTSPLFYFEKYTENKYKQFSFQSWNQILKQFLKNLETLRKLLAIRRALVVPPLRTAIRVFLCDSDANNVWNVDMVQTGHLHKVVCFHSKACLF